VRGRLERGEVIFFFPEELIPNMLLAPANATRQILPDYLTDPLSLEAVDHFFHQYYWSKVDYDRQEILAELTSHGVGNFQFAQAARFALIDSPTQPVIIPWGAAGETVCHHLRRLDVGDRPGLLRRLARKAQRYSVNVYPQELEILLAAGTIETVHEKFLILADRQLYSPTIGLLRQDAGADVPDEIG
jgi:CRISPR-associated endonuclease/helicase Cas3